MPTNDSLLLGAEPIRKRSLVMIIVVDTSGSMEGTRIGSVNTALEELIPELAAVGEADAEIKLAVLTFSDVCNWLTPSPMPPEEFIFEPLRADGLTCLGMACKELSRRMSRADLFLSPGSSYAPIIILMSDGEPTDQYQEGLEELSKNKWFQTAIKYALPIGMGVDIEALAAFTGSTEAVLKPATRPSDLIKKIKMVALESAKFSTISRRDKVDGQEAPKREVLISQAIETGLSEDATDDDSDGDGW